MMYYIEFPYTLFRDPQTDVPEEFCISCGCECYVPGLKCLRCERRKKHDFAADE